MQFLKKHYEKIILSTVLLGLAAAAFWLSVAVDEAQRQMTGVVNTEPSQKAWVPIDLSEERAALAALRNPPGLELTGAHNLFNPVTWKRRRNGDLFKVLLEGAAALSVTDINPLYDVISYDAQAGDGYYLTFEPVTGRRSRGYAKLNEKDKSKPYEIVGTNAAADGTSALQLLITETGDTVTVTTNTPYKRIDGYEADMKYPPDSAAFTKKRTGEVLMLSGEPYKMIAITNNAVTVQDTRTTQKTTIEWTHGH